MKTKMKIKRVTILFSMLLATFFGCNYNSFEKPNVNAAPTNVEDKQAAFEADLQTMRTANLKYVFVFRRTDGGVFDGEDKRYLRANLPTTNRVILSDENKAFIVGSNYKFPPENLEILRLRFNVEENSTAEVK